MITHTKQSAGFALLLTLVVVSVVLAIGLSLLDITLKQLVLSGTARDSEIAFQAAYAGTECAEHWIRDDRLSFVNNTPDLQSCFGGTLSGAAIAVSPPTTGVSGSHYNATWGPAGDQRCTAFDIYMFDADTNPGDITYDFELLYGFPSQTCQDGRVCAYIFSRGYNRACNDTSSLRVVQREVVTKF